MWGIFDDESANYSEFEALAVFDTETEAMEYVNTLEADIVGNVFVRELDEMDELLYEEEELED